MKKTKTILTILTGLLFAVLFGGVVASHTSNAVGVFAMVISACAMFAPIPGGSLATLFTPAQVSWHGKEVMDMGQTIFDNAFANPELSAFHSIFEDIVAKTQIVFLGTLSKISKADAGCNTSPTSKSISMSEKFWEPAKIKFWLSQCADDLEQSFWVWGLDNGIKRKDLTQGNFASFMMQRIEEALVEDWHRIAWFNDTDAGNVDGSPIGVLTSGVDVTDYNMIDGLWKQIFAEVAADSTKRYTITENAGGNYTAQDALATDRALVMLRAMYQRADKRLKNDKTKFFILTDSLVDNYETYLESQAVDSSFKRVQESERVGPFDTGLRFRGIPIMCFDFWDRTIRADFDNGTTWDKPHRAVLTTKTNMPVGFDAQSAAMSMDVYYDKKDETTNWKSAYKMDAKLLKPYMFMAAY